MTFVGLFNAMVMLTLMGDFLERRFPNEFKQIVTEVMFKGLYLYTRIQLLLTKAKTHINNHVKMNPQLMELKNIWSNSIQLNNVEVIRNGNVVDAVFLDSLMKNGYEGEYDFMIYYDDKNYDENCKCINKIIFDDPKTFTGEYTASNMKFILTEIAIGAKMPHKMDLKTENYNFYVSGNKISRQFCEYYLKQILGIKSDIEKNEPLKLNIIDGEFNSISIDVRNDEVCEILEDSYRVIKNSKKEE